MDIKKYRVKPNKKVDLEKFSTKKDDSYSKQEVKEEILPQNLEKMFEFQEKLYAENKREFSLCFKRWMLRVRTVW